MKKIITIMAVLAVMTSFAACGDKKDEKGNDSSSKQVAAENNDGAEDNADDDGENTADADDDDDEQKPVADDSPITVDDVLNHPETPAEDFEYRDGDFVVIEGYIGSDPIVVIPEQINGHPVMVVNANGFNLDSKVKGVSFPSGVTELSGTFNCNKNIQVVIAKGIEEVDDGAFNQNGKLKYVDLGPNLIELRECQFVTDEELEIHIPESTTEIDSYMWEEKTTIVGAAGSYAETYANENGIKFEVG
ncbi:MAG: leucine-rich repeat protein [Clostridia bacterium]|nr:leucine-rich repeat protein [Clostridia bacterium]